MELTLSLDNLNKIYYAGETIQGSVLVINKSKQTIKYDLLMKVIGYFTFKNLKTNPPQAKIVQFYKKTYTVQPDLYSTIGANNSYRFKFPLNSESCESNQSSLYEGYHGVNVSVSYEIISEAIFSGKKYISNKHKILVYVPGQGISPKFGRKKVNYQFSLDPKKIQNNKLQDQNMMPNFIIEGYLDNINCCIDKPFNGYCNIKECSLPIKSIELQFSRNEKILFKDFAGNNEVSEIQNLQIGDGDVVRDLEIPVFMTFPRGFCCANLDTKEVKISFELNIMIVLANGVVIMENFPINLWRG